MITVVTPTMWRVPGLFLQALNNYILCDKIDEIIIINNDVGRTPYLWSELNHEKIKILNTQQNIFVNPAWNIGVSIAKNDKICLANDDIIFDMRLINKIYDRIIPSNGVHGIIAGEAAFNQPLTTDGAIEFMAWQNGNHIHSFGQLMFIHRQNWRPIIDGLNIYFGDDFIFHWHLYRGLINYMVYNIHFHSPMACTAKDTTITGGFYEREQPIFSNWFNMHPIPFSNWF